MLLSTPISTRNDTSFPHNTLHRSLVIIDPVMRPNHAPQSEHDAVRTGVIKREKAFATAGNDACPIDAKLSFFPHQPELHGMPVKPRQPVQRAILQTAQ